MRIAQISPLIESVPPQGYGGTERVVSYLTEELVRQGHEVTLFASGDSITHARLIPQCKRALRLDPRSIDYYAPLMLMIEHVFQRANEFDVLHFHTDYFHLSLAMRQAVPMLTTLHGRLDLPDYAPIFREFAKLPFVSISDAQRKPMPWLTWAKTVYHGLPPDAFPYQKGPGNYLAFLGRTSPEKRLDRAIAIAARAGMPLKVAAKVDSADRAYFDAKLRPLLAQSHVEFLGEIQEREKKEFLGNAQALLFPIDWPEPFGLAMIEAMACGTPVIAFRRGSIPEVINENATGFVVDSIDEAVAAVEKVKTLSRRRCREMFERRFSAERMAQDYLDVYRRLAALAIS